MQAYKTFQVNRIIATSIPILMVWVLIAYFFQIGPNPIPLAGMILMELFLLIAVLLFYGLTISVTRENIRLRFGIGLITIKIKLNSIKDCKLVKNRWYYGVGIRLIPHGILYNAHGLSALELAFKNKKRIVRIGTSNTEKLKKEIEQQINSHKPRMS